MSVVYGQMDPKGWKNKNYWSVLKMSVVYGQMDPKGWKNENFWSVLKMSVVYGGQMNLKGWKMKILDLFWRFLWCTDKWIWKAEKWKFLICLKMSVVSVVKNENSWSVWRCLWCTGSWRPSTTLTDGVTEILFFKGDILEFLLFTYSTLLHLPPPQIPLCRRMLGSDFGIGCQTL